MHLWLVSLVFVASSVTLVHSWCRSSLKNKSDYKKTCKNWWEKASEYNSRWKIEGCVEKIRKKCPSFLKVDDQYDVRDYAGAHHITWRITVRAYDSYGNWVEYDKYERTGVCKGDDAGLGTCNSWWRAAVKVKSNHVVDRCVSLIEKECPTLLTKVNETKKNKRHNGKRATVISLTYSYEYSEVSFNRYIYRKE